MSIEAAPTITDPSDDTATLDGALASVSIGAAVGVFIVATAGSATLFAAASGAAVATAGRAGSTGEALGRILQEPPNGRIRRGSPSVLIDPLGHAKAQASTADCDPHDDRSQVTSAVATAPVDSRPIARVGEEMDDAALIQDAPDVVIGGDGPQVLSTTLEDTAAFDTTLGAMAIGGVILATGGTAAAYVAPAAVGALVGRMAGGVSARRSRARRRE